MIVVIYTFVNKKVNPHEHYKATDSSKGTFTR